MAADDGPDLRQALQRRGGAYRRAGSTASAPPEVNTILSPAHAAKAGLGWLKGLAGLPREGDVSDMDEPQVKDDSAGMRSLLSLSLFSPLSSSPTTPEKKTRRPDDRLRPRFQARGGLVGRPDPAESPASLAPVKEEEVEPYLDSMETEARRRLEGLEDLTTMDLSDGERSPDQSEELVTDFEFESAPTKRTEVRTATSDEGVEQERSPAAAESAALTPVDKASESEGTDHKDGPAGGLMAAEVTSPQEEVADQTGTDFSANIQSEDEGRKNSPIARRRTWALGEAAQRKESLPQADADQAPREILEEPSSQGCSRIVCEAGQSTPQARENPNKFRDLREFWSKSSVGFASSGTKELSVTEAQAKLQRLSTSSAPDLNEVRELRKRISLMHDAPREAIVESEDAAVESPCEAAT
mmetsp:Transcript_42323/g.76779  ORF Transcript_42323/g.76779 Transcript_42323/m.76779 type:complete len:414 (-) Transcript_42323:51-1292(-)